MWTDEELDQALADQPAGPGFSAEARARALSRLRQADAVVVPLVASARRRTAWWWAAAAAVVILAGVALGATTGRAPAATAAAVAQLDQASAATTGTSAGPGRYFYTATREWALGAAQTSKGNPLAQLQETLYETWIPHDRSGDWIKITTVTGRTRWLIGDDDLARREGDGGLRSRPTVTREHGPCGDYPSANGELGTAPAPAVPCDRRPGDWYTPTPAFLAGLPDDPEQLYERLRTDAADLGPAEMLRMAGGVLTCEAAGQLRSSVYRALMLMPGLDVTTGAVDLDGRHGVALGVTTGATRQEIVIDPRTGLYLGERLVLAQPGSGMWQGLPTGTVADYTAVTTGTVAGPADRISGA
ncbi:CU044_5270 family protein [Actinoplanes siamensis]|uniref:Uncharacterized protein n=1 Tax=Actinoplanes siamensis TaxID=1223317 RepID=A0A919ND36_9ACTN|nr:CU044_5270 family protein [Actinoplanes siamensis]GIF08540.1 hypothetical protein Asi03nite_60780 [Actinoplanes siamensis]